MLDQQVLAVMKAYVAQEMLHGDARGLDEKSPLLEWGVIESLSMVALIAYVEQTFGVKIPDEDLVPGNFADLTAITEMIVRRRGGAQAAG